MFQHLNYVILFLFSACRADGTLVHWHFLYHVSDHLLGWSSRQLIFQISDSLLLFTELIPEISDLIFESVDLSSVNFDAAIRATTESVVSWITASFLVSGFSDPAYFSLELIVFITDLINDLICLLQLTGQSFDVSVGFIQLIIEVSNLIIETFIFLLKVQNSGFD